MKTQFIPIDYDYFDYNSKTHVKIIGRNEKGKKICIIDTFQPFFWAILKPKSSEKTIKQIQDKINKIKIEKAGRLSKVIKTELHNKNFLGKSVKAIKIFVTNYKDAHAIADELPHKFIEHRRGYDIPYITQYIIERKLFPLQEYEIDGDILTLDGFSGISQSLDIDIILKANSINKLKEKEFHPKILAYDIETDEFEIGKGEILMISLYGDNYKKVLTWKKQSKKSYVETFKDEADMLEAFIKHVKEYDPDILTGYFSDGFDLPYLRARAEKNHMKLNLGIDNSQPSFSRGALMTGKIKGIVHIDLLRFIRNAYSQYLQSETLSLNEVSKELLEDKKIELNPYEEANSKDTDWEKFFEYNLKDSELTYRLLEKIWPDLSEITKIIQEPLFNISRSTMAGNFEDLIIHNLDRFNEIPERRPKYEDIGKRRAEPRYEGALVLQPKPGLYNKIGFFDFSSMYASVIVSYNLSKSTETKIKNKKESHQGEYLGKKAYFLKKPLGFVPTLLKEITDKRREVKKEYNKNPNPISKARSNAFKLIANAAYGYQGFFGGRYYSIEAASSTAFFARENIKQAISKIKKAGYPIIYSDTDSIAFELKNHTEKQALELLKQINKTLPGIMELDLEDFYKRGIWVTKRTGDFGAKKKYALIDKKGKIKIRGFETVRRDWCMLAREVQNKVLNLILKEGNEKKALEYVKEIIKKIKNRKIELKQLLIKTQLKKPIEEYKSESPHVTIAKKMREQNMPIDLGMLIEYYIAEPEKHQRTKKGKNKALVRERAKLPTEKEKYDIDYYLNNQILPAVENIFEVFKVNTKELVDGKQQKKLFEF